MDHQYDKRRDEALVAQIAALRTDRCDMAHERVLRDVDGRPLLNPRSETGHRRAGICPAEIRLRQLACSHTTARLSLLDALDVKTSEGCALRAEVERLDGAIGMLDHRRFAAEGRRADAVLAADASAVAAADTEIAALVAEHRGQATRLAEIRVIALEHLRSNPSTALDGV